MQYKYLEAITGQQTPYLRFRFRSIIGSYTGSYDYLRIYLPDNLAQEPFSPVNNHNDLVCQFLPATSSGGCGPGTAVALGLERSVRLVVANEDADRRLWSETLHPLYKQRDALRRPSPQPELEP